MEERKATFRHFIVSVLSYLGVFFIGMLTAPYQGLYEQWAKAPDVDVEFEMKHPYFFRGTFSAPSEKPGDQDGEKGRESRTYSSYICRFGLVNRSGMVTAEDCEVFLTGILHEQKDGNFIPEPNFEPVKLKTYLGGEAYRLETSHKPSYDSIRASFSDFRSGISTKT